MQNFEFQASICVAIVATLLVCSLGISSIVIGAKDYYDTCQGDDRSKVSLGDWLIAYGSADIGFVTTLWIMGTLIVKEIINVLWAIIPCVVFVCFKVAWFIIGIVILARSHWECRSHDLGIMTLIALSCTVVCFISSLCKNRKSE